MKYIHGGNIKKKTGAGPIVRLIIGSVLLLLTMIIFIGFFASFADYGPDDDQMLSFVMTCITFLPGGAVLFITGLIPLCRSKEFPRHDLSMMLPMDMNNPFFTTKCERCGLVFDYQSSDLGFRPWYPNGYTDCPRCDNNIRHNAQTNVFCPDERAF